VAVVDNEANCSQIGQMGYISLLVVFNNEAVHGCSIRLEEHLKGGLGVDLEGKEDHAVVAEEGTRMAAAADNRWQEVEAVGPCTAHPAEASS